MSRSQLPTPPSRTSGCARSAPAESDEEHSPSAGARPLSRNAQAQARLRARRKAYVESLESSVKRLQTMVDALSSASSRGSYTPMNCSSHQAPLSSQRVPSMSLNPPSPDLALGNTSPPPEGQTLERLQLENGRLRRERDALRVQLEALVSYISKGHGALPGLQSNIGTPDLQSYRVDQAELSNSSSQSYVSNNSYACNDMLDVRTFNQLDLTLQAYLNMVNAAQQYSAYQAEQPSPAQPFETSMHPATSSNAVDLSSSLRRKGSPDGSDPGGSFRM